MSRNRREGAGRRVGLTEARRLRRKVTLDFCLVYVQFWFFVQVFMLPGPFSPYKLCTAIYPEFRQPPKGPSLCAQHIGLN